MRRAASYVLLVLFGLYLVYYILQNHEKFQQLMHLNLYYLALIALGHTTVIFLNGLFVKFILEPYKKNISAKESFFVSLISTIGNYFFPVGTGTGVKAVYLKRKFNLSYGDFMSTLSGNYIVVFMLDAGLGLVAVLMLRKYAPGYQIGALIIVLGGIFVTMLILAFYGFPRFIVNILNKSKILRRLSAAISHVLHGWNEITRDRKLLWQLTLLTLANFAVTAGITCAAIRSLGFGSSFWVLILYTALASLSLLLNITPGSIGIRESMFILISTTLALSIPQILSISIVVNGVLFFVLIGSWLLLQLKFIKRRVLPPAISADI